MEPPQRTDAESAVIAELIACTPTLASPEGPGDDCACLPEGAVCCVDTLVEGVHWNERLDPSDVGFKALAVNVSDLAAMGAKPDWMLLALSLPSPLDRGWVREFAQGLGEAARRWGVTLRGGDTTRSLGGRFVSVTLAGRCQAAPLTRSGGRVGDALWVTGRLGLAGAGWADDNPSPDALAALRRPNPPLGFALELARRGLATAAIDISDGLATDLPRLCTASGCGATVEPEDVPGDAYAWTGGEDYQLLFASPSHLTDEVHHAAQQAQTTATRIGVLTEGALVLRGRPWPVPLFQHWNEA